MQAPHNRRPLAAVLVLFVVLCGVGLAALWISRSTSPDAAAIAPASAHALPAPLDAATPTRAVVATPSDEVCDGVDNDIDTKFDEGCECARRFTFERPELWNPGVRDMQIADDGTILAFGEAGTLLRYDGRAWRSISRTTPRIVGAVRDVDGSFVLFGEHTLLRFDGRRASTFVDATAGRRGVPSRVAGDFASAITLEGWGVSRRMEIGWVFQSTGQTPMAAHVLSPESALVVGASGLAGMLESGSFRALSVPTADTLLGAWGVSPSDAYAVGGNKIFHFDGTTWSVAFEDPALMMVDVAGVSASDVRVLATTETDVRILTWNGTLWAPSATTASPMSRIYVAGPRTYTITRRGDIMRLDVGTWTTDVPWSGPTTTDVAGASPDDLLFVGGGGRADRYDGKTFTPIAVEGGETIHFTSVAPIGRGRWIAGASAQPGHEASANGFIVECDATRCALREALPSAARDVWVSSTGTAFVVGDEGLVVQMSRDQTRNHSVPRHQYTGVFGFSDTDVYVSFAAGPHGMEAGGGVMRWDGAQWSVLFRSDTGYVATVRGRSPDDLYIAGGSAATDAPSAFAYRWDGTRWTSILRASGTLPIEAMWMADSGRVYFVSETASGRASLKRWDGAQTTTITTIEGGSTASIFGTSENNIFLVGEHGFVRHRCGDPVAAPAPVAPPVTTPPSTQAPTPAPASAASPPQATAPRVLPSAAIPFDRSALRAVVLVGTRADYFWEAYGVTASAGVLVPLDLRVDPGYASEGEFEGNTTTKLSPDGRYIAYYYRNKLHVRDVRTGLDRVIPGDARGHHQTSLVGFSASSKALLYFVVTMPDENVNGGLHRAYVLADGTTRDVRINRETSLPLVLEDESNVLMTREDPHTRTLDLVRHTFSGGFASRTIATYTSAYGVCDIAVSQGELTWVAPGRVMIADRGGAVQQVAVTGMQNEWRHPKFSPSNALLAVIGSRNSVNVFRRATGQLTPAYGCRSEPCSAMFLDETRLLVRDGTLVLRVQLDGVSIPLRERVVDIAYAGGR